MTSNVYDDPRFFIKYSQMRRSIEGLAGAGEWEALRKTLPPLQGRRVLDLGCGYGWHCQYAVEQGAQRVVGLDLSERMLQVAKQKTAGSIEYIHTGIQDAQFAEGSFDVVFSSLAFHYLEEIDSLFGRVHAWLASGGHFVFSVEHPIFTAEGSQDWVRDAQGTIQFFPVDNYFYEGRRQTTFLGEEVTKFHRSLTTYVQALLRNGFELLDLVEPQPSEKLATDMADDFRRPIMLILSAAKR